MQTREHQAAKQQEERWARNQNNTHVIWSVGEDQRRAVLVGPRATAPRIIARRLPHPRRANRLYTTMSPAPRAVQRQNDNGQKQKQNAEARAGGKKQNCAVVRSEWAGVSNGR